MNRTLLTTLSAIALCYPLGLLPFSGNPAYGADIAPPISERFKTLDTTENPNFRRHVVPLLGRLGCNGRACHGSFQGAGGFRLSLFGYDFKMDHDNLTTGETPRVDLEVPEESLILQKPLEQLPHKGGKRFEAQSWQHNVLHSWIKQGAKPLIGDESITVKLEVTPSEIQFQKTGEQVQLKILAHWSDGAVEDVAPLCRFQTNDDSVAKIDEHGLLTATGPGDTHVVVFYDNAVVPIPVVRPVSELTGDKYPTVPTPTKVDELVVNKLKKLGIVPSAECTDQEFLRRVSLDLTGTLPAPKEVEAFLADGSPDKRKKKVDELLERPAYAAWWATKLCDITGNNDQVLNNLQAQRDSAAQQWYDWLRIRVANNLPYDKLVEGIVTAVSRKPGESYLDYSKSMSEMYHKDSKKSYADLEGLSYFWARRNFRTPNERALGFAYAFLGVRIQCAECHKHPFDQWTQSDYKQFTGFFGRVQYGRSPEANKVYNEMLAELKIDPKKKGNDARKELATMLKEGKTIPFEELWVVAPKPRKVEKAKEEDQAEKKPEADKKPDGAKNKNKPKPVAKPQKPKRPDRPEPVVTAKLLGADTVDIGTMPDPRTALMGWLRDTQNPYFARAFVNRVWASYFNVGIVQPADDLSLANAPSNKELLDYLARGFIENKFDMKWLHREIVNSRTYQLSWTPTETNKLDERNFSRAIPRRLPAEVAYDAAYQATCGDAEIEAMRTDVSKRAIAVPGTQARGGNRAAFALTVFGRSTRETNCDCDRSMEASLLQTVYLKNDDEVLASISRRGGWVDQLVTPPRANAKGQPGKNQPGKNQPGADDTPADILARIEGLKRIVEKLKSGGDEKKLRKAEARLAELVKRSEKQAEKPAAAPPAVEKSEGVTQVSATVPALPFQTAEVIRQAYLRTLSRLPTDEELERSTRFIHEAKDGGEGLRGLLWALINTKEFIVNH